MDRRGTRSVCSLDQVDYAQFEQPETTGLFFLQFASACYFSLCQAKRLDLVRDNLPHFVAHLKKKKGGRPCNLDL